MQMCRYLKDVLPLSLKLLILFQQVRNCELVNFARCESATHSLPSIHLTNSLDKVHVMRSTIETL